MAYYYINKNAQTTGENEVHTTGCPKPPDLVNQVEIGHFDNCHQAVAAAKRKWPNHEIDGCYYCCNACHTT